MSLKKKKTPELPIKTTLASSLEWHTKITRIGPCKLYGNEIMANENRHIHTQCYGILGCKNKQKALKLLLCFGRPLNFIISNLIEWHTNVNINLTRKRAKTRR